MCCHTFCRIRIPSVLQLAAILLPLAALGGGCGGSDKPPVANDNARVMGVVTSLSEVTGNPKQFQSMFAEGAAPKDSERAEYAKYNYQLKSRQASISGDTATVTVELTDRASGSAVGEKEWKVVKAGDTWKLKEAPLH
jgi:hypothetical protein